MEWQAILTLDPATHEEEEELPEQLEDIAPGFEFHQSATTKGGYAMCARCDYT